MKPCPSDDDMGLAEIFDTAYNSNVDEINNCPEGECTNVPCICA